MVTPVLKKEGPLSAKELDLLEGFLSSVGPEAMNLEEFDGFLAALIVGPETIMPSEYWPEVLGTEEFQFKTMEDAEKILGLVMRHWNTIAVTLNAGEIYEPILLEDEKGVATGNGWSAGFMRGIEMRFEAWQSFIDDDETAGLVLPIIMLAHENDPDPKLRTPTLNPQKREQVLISMAAALPQIFKLFQAQRSPTIAPYKRTDPKVGRNDPCPCGSGKKYKHCCGVSPSMH